MAPVKRLPQAILRRGALAGSLKTGETLSYGIGGANETVAFELGPAEGAITAFYASGKLHSFYLVNDQTVQGVPCRGGEWGIFTDTINGGNHVALYEDGRLQSCKLTRDFGGQKRGRRITLAQ